MSSRTRKPAESKAQRPEFVHGVPDELTAEDPFANWFVGPSEIVNKEKSRGRPTIENNILWGTWAKIIYLLEENWHRVGWKLQCLRGRSNSHSDDVRVALEPLRGQHYWEQISVLLQPSVTLAKGAEVRHTAKRLTDLRVKLQAAELAFNTSCDELREARRVVYLTSKRCGKHIKTQITYRIGNRINLKEEVKQKEKLVTAAQRKLKKATPRSVQKIQGQLAAEQRAGERLAETLAGEEKIIADLRAQLRNVGKKNWRQARDVVKQRLKIVRTAKAEVEHCKTEIEQLEPLYQEQATGFSQCDFLKFVVQKRALHHPRQLAKALAGLPLMACRESFTRCKDFEFHNEPHFNYYAFDLIDKAWARRKTGDRTRALIALAHEQIERIRKADSRRQLMLDRFNDLRDAVESVASARPQPLPGEVPYLVTAQFLDSFSRPKTPFERVLSQPSPRQ